MISVEALKRICEQYDPGYATVYAFRKEDALKVKESGSSAGLDKFEVFADCLTLDLDSGDEQLADTEAKLQEKGLKYEVWSSGGKGYHVVIPHEPIWSHDLPYSHRQVVRSLGIESDFTLYQHGRLISLPGRVHPKTGRKKALIKVIAGELIDIPIVKRPKPTFNFEPNGGLNYLQSGLTKALDMTLSEPSPGNRHTRLWAASEDLANAGLEFETVLNIMQEVNASWQNSKEREEVELAVSQAFRKRRQT